MEIAKTPEPPYHAVTISVKRTTDDQGYLDMADAMYQLAQRQQGFLGMEWVDDAEHRESITVSYWTDDEAVRQWKRDTEHLTAQRLGKERWYEAYRIRVCVVQREYGWQRA